MPQNSLLLSWDALLPLLEEASIRLLDGVGVVEPGPDQIKSTYRAAVAHRLCHELQSPWTPSHALQHQLNGPLRQLLKAVAAEAMHVFPEPPTLRSARNGRKVTKKAAAAVAKMLTDALGESVPLERLLREEVNGHLPPHQKSTLRASPFVGLRPFTPAHAHFYFGLTESVDQLTRVVLDPAFRLIVVIGPSGSGKSSLIGAGLLPRLSIASDRRPGGWLLPTIDSSNPIGQWTWSGLRFTPSEFGDDPFIALAAKIAASGVLPDCRLPVLAQMITSDRVDLAQFVKEALSMADREKLLVFIDQFEELFSVCRPELVPLFVRSLLQIAGSGDAKVVVSVRSDFFEQLLQSDLLSTQNACHVYPVAAPGLGSVLSILRSQAEYARVSIGSGVEERIAAELGQNPGALPLLGFTLQQLFSDGVLESGLTHEALDSIGGVAGAIGSRAENTYISLPKEFAEDSMRLFSALVEVSESGSCMRRRVPARQLSKQVGIDPKIWQPFVDARILMSDSLNDGTPAIEVAHEAVFTHWPRLQKWIGDRVDAIRVVRRIEREAVNWDRSGRPEYLLPAHEVVHEFDRAQRLLGTRQMRDKTVESYCTPEVDRLTAKLMNPTLSHEQRRHIGDRLAEIGDSRKGVSLRDGVPDIDWIWVAHGDDVSDSGARGFYIARYVVTNSQFNCFLETSDAKDRESSGLGLVADNGALAPPPLNAKCNAPRDRVSWHMARAFAAWLTSKIESDQAWRTLLLPTGMLLVDPLIRLPTEYEWMRAARPPKSTLKFPWGEWSDNYANTNSALIGRSLSVGLYPHGQSWCGAHDMAGNVAEWCFSNYDTSEADIDADCSKVLKGGSFYHPPIHASIDYRRSMLPGNAFSNFGFRLALCENTRQHDFQDK